MITHITKTWFVDGQIIEQEIPEADIYMPEALRLADTIDPFTCDQSPDHQTCTVIAAELRRLHEENERLKAQQTEPVAYIQVSKTGNVMACAKTEDFYKLPDKTLLYTSPPPRQPLTDEEILVMARGHYNPHQRSEISFARAIEAALGIKGQA